MRHDLDTFRRFVLFRLDDQSGVSGTGIVAEGVQFSSGTCVLTWLSDTPSTNIYENIDEINLIHGHHGNTEIRWVDKGM